MSAATTLRSGNPAPAALVAAAASTAALVALPILYTLVEATSVDASHAARLLFRPSWAACSSTQFHSSSQRDS
jgi:hypothetical protein